MPRKNLFKAKQQESSKKKSFRNEKIFKTLLKINNHEEHELENMMKETNRINHNHLSNLKRSKARLERAIEIRKNNMENKQKIRKNKNKYKIKLQEYEIKVADITEKLEVLKRRCDFKTDEEIVALKEKILSLNKRKLGNKVDKNKIFQDIKNRN